MRKNAHNPKNWGIKPQVILEPHIFSHQRNCLLIPQPPPASLPLPWDSLAPEFLPSVSLFSVCPFTASFLPAPSQPLFFLPLHSLFSSCPFTASLLPSSCSSLKLALPSGCFSIVFWPLSQFGGFGCGFLGLKSIWNNGEQVWGLLHGPGSCHRHKLRAYQLSPRWLAV